MSPAASRGEGEGVSAGGEGITSGVRVAGSDRVTQDSGDSFSSSEYRWVSKKTTVSKTVPAIGPEREDES